MSRRRESVDTARTKQGNAASRGNSDRAYAVGYGRPPIQSRFQPVASGSSAQFEAGAVFFPKAAPWLSGLKAELLGFPNVRYDDQVDSVTQALAWIEKRKQSYAPTVCPVIVRVHNPYREAFPDYRDVPR